MKSNILHLQCVDLCNQYLQESTGCECKPSGEAKWIELGYKNVIQSWFRVERKADGYHFVSDEEKNNFLKSTHSELAGWANFLFYYIDPVVAAG